jgi:nitrite reductase/ring-hydroxylating ferredoxin subunit
VLPSAKNPDIMDRRLFLLNTCRACAALAVAPLAASLEGCAAPAKALAVKDSFLEVPLDALGSAGSAIVKAEGLPNKLYIARRADGGYTAVELSCPHKGGPVQEKDGRLVCQWHGSTFELDGRLIKGPSKQDLKRYPVQQEGKSLRVRVG